MSARIDTNPCPVPAWLPGGHAQTLYGALCAQHPTLHFVRERVDTPDGDFIDLDWCAPRLNPNRHPAGQASPHVSGLVGTAARPGPVPRPRGQQPEPVHAGHRP